ncbi:hypothetical protein H5410_063549 [Solanum commersonii]|uniref:PGG domain-containing protein n=1 Tax=Solanum commersonii TaxID=4109 RepID=A0A9J5WEN0_SOLCO|nr:hypothetical protein H5410_063549 [Solanum commersonii]
MASEIQTQLSGQGMGMGRPSSNESTEKANQAIKDQIFQAAMENKWTKVKHLYINNKFVHESKLTRSEDTALHLAITSYHPDRDDSLQHPHLTCIKEMIADISKENRLCILKQKNDKGNTPLHLAAELGSVPIIECMVNSADRDLIWETNSKGETPLFVAAYRGKLQAFLYLHNCCLNEKGEGPIELCRREDGDNILHAAISGEYFEWDSSINNLSCNRSGFSDNTLLWATCQPLQRRGHVSSTLPFQDASSIQNATHLLFSVSHKHPTFAGWFMFIVCEGTNIEELELMTYEAEDKEDSFSKLEWNLPENYQTMVEFLELLWNGTLKTLNYLKRTYCGNQEDPSKVPKNFTCSKTDSLFYSITTGATNENQEKSSQAERKRNRKLFPANYTIFIEFLKCIMKIVLIVLGIGLQRTKKLEERKRQHTWGVQIMKLMIEKEERYKFYESTGEKPEDTYLYSQIGAPPTAPPPTDDIAQIEQPPTSSTDKKKDDLKPGKEPLFFWSYLCGTENFVPGHQDCNFIITSSEAICTLKATRIIIVLNTEMSKTKETPLLVASKMGTVEMVQRILKKFPIAIQDTDCNEKNILLLAVEHRQTDVYNWLIGEKYPEYVFYHVDKHGNNAVHLAAMYQKLEVWRIPGSALQLQGERKWYKYVKHTLPPQSYVRYNNKGQTPRQIFVETHAKLLSDGTQWLITTANSFSVVAALIATVAFATSATIPGGADDNGHPHLENQPAFDVFSITSLVSLCFSVTALVFFLAILTSRCRHNDFEKDLPRKLLLGLTSLFASITAILISFCAAHFFVLRDTFRTAAIPIYGVTCIPVVFFAFNQLPLYVDLIRSYIQNLPLRSYKVFYTDSSEATSSDQKKEGKEKDD